MRCGYIYKLTLNQDVNHFKKNEVYIGKHNGVKPEYFGSGKIVKRLISKYGKSIFNKEIIALDIDNEELLCYMEVYYINFYKSNRSIFQYGLNLTNGGEGIHGYKRSKEAIEKHRIKIKEAYSSGKRKPPKQKEVNQYNIETGKYIKSFENCTIAAREVGCIPSSIASASRDEYSSCKGFIWSYRKEDIIDKIAGRGKPILQYNLEGNLINEYSSALKASQVNNWKNAPISNCLNGRSKSSYGYLWKYK
jgi:hypothetical protein